MKVPKKAVKLKRQQGVYFCLKEGVVIYIGKSVNIPARLIAHEFFFDEVRYIPLCYHRDMHEIERKMIKKFKPIHNKMYVTYCTN